MNYCFLKLRFLLSTWIRQTFILLYVVAIPALQSYGQNILSDIQIEIIDIAILGNNHFDENEIKEIFSTRETPSKISKLFYNILGDKFGSKPEYFYPDIFEGDLVSLRQLYNDNGFFDVEISKSYLYNSDTTGIELTISLKENIRTVIDNIEYKGIEDADPQIHEAILKEPLILKGQPYQKNKINDEVYRILDIIMNYGYPFARIVTDSSKATRYYSSNKIDIVYAFDIQTRYKFGEININVAPYREDITDNIVYKQLDFKKGEWISKNKISSSEKSLNKLSVFEAARIEVQPDSSDVIKDEVPVKIMVRPRNKHELAPEIIISDEDNTFNLGLGAGYTNHNFLGDARSFNSRLRFSTQSIHEWNFNSIFGKGGISDPSILGKIEAQLQLTQPSLFTKNLSGLWTLSFTADKKNFYAVTIAKNKMSLINQFATYTTGFFEWTLERSDVNWLEDTLKVGLGLSRLKEEEQPQFNSIFTFTLQRDKTNDIFSPTKGFFHVMSIEESGLLQKVFKNIQPTLPYTQFYKITLLGKWYIDLSRTKFNIFAAKLKAGYQDKYGESKQNPNLRIPLNRRYFSGGSGSVRAWKTRTLGAMPDNEVALGGNFVFEGNNELRVNHLRGLGKLWFLDLQNFWGVYFIDYGNVWRTVNEFSLKDIAMDAGIGIRYDTFVGPARLDFGFRVYDPKEPRARQWFYTKKFFNEVLYNGVLNFGIGHAF